jgi:hypothetical protein
MYTEAQHKTLMDECKQWYDVLASYREKINQLDSELYTFAPGKTDHDILVGIEHFHNQFHIQLVNIHDMRHDIRNYVNETEQHPNFPHRIPHHYKKEKLDALLANLDQLEEEFHAFIKK